MITDLKINDDEGRARALERLEVLDTLEEQPFENIMNLVQQVFQAPMCAVSLVDRHRQWFKARRGLDVCQTTRQVSFCTHTIQGDVAFIIPDALQDSRFVDSPLVNEAPFIRSYAGIPLRTPDGYNVGSLCVMDTKPREYTREAITILENFAGLVVDELELRQIASTDHLTGALTRRAWMEAARNELVRAGRYERPLSLAVLDIDRFKAVNDTYGHPAGDKVIRRLAELCMEVMRDTDLFCRWGGEEFVLLMPETDLQGALVVAERIRTLLAGQDIDVGQRVRSTVSIGLAELRRQEGSLDALIERADKALYLAKDGGRNQSVVFKPPSAIRAAA